MAARESSGGVSVVVLQGDMVQYRVSWKGNTIFEYVPDPDEALDEEVTNDAMVCGYTPTFDR